VKRVDGATFVVVLAHLGVGTLWLGSMTYSLFVVQPRVARVLTDPVKAEDVYRELGAGNRWRVIGLIAVLAASGIGLLFVHGGHSGTWWLVIAFKAALLVAASALFWWVSWRGWPLRVFALPAEIPGVQARFRRVALGMVALVGCAFVLGVAASHLL
jgi:hypothetical protein